MARRHRRLYPGGMIPAPPVPPEPLYADEDGLPASDPAEWTLTREPEPEPEPIYDDITFQPRIR